MSGGHLHFCPCCQNYHDDCGPKPPEYARNPGYLGNPDCPTWHRGDQGDDMACLPCLTDALGLVAQRPDRVDLAIVGHDPIGWVRRVRAALTDGSEP